MAEEEGEKKEKKKTRSFSEDVGNQLGTVGLHFHRCSPQNKGSAAGLLFGPSRSEGRLVTRWVRGGVGGARFKGHCTEDFFSFFFFVAGLFS